MKGLLIKEKVTLFSSASFIWYLVLSLIFGAMGVLGNMPTWLFFIGFLLANLPYTTLTGDEMSGWVSYSLTMPVSRRDFVNAKYVGTLIMYVFSLVVVSLFLVIYGLTGKDAVSAAKMVLPLSASVPLVMPSYGMPLNFKFGSEKAKVIGMGMGAACGLICSGALTASNALEKTSVTLAIPMIIAVIVAICLFGISWAVSIKLFESKEY